MLITFLPILPEHFHLIHITYCSFTSVERIFHLLGFSIPSFVAIL